jgi:hypothetical protein
MAQFSLQPERGIDWGRVLQSGISGYTQARGIQQRQQQFDRQQQLDEEARQRREQQAQIEADERFRRERALTALDIQGKPKEYQTQVLRRRVQMVQERGGDPSNTQGLLDLIEKDDPQAQSFIQNAVSQGEREGYIKPQARPGAASLTATQKDLIAAGYQPGTPEFQDEMKKEMSGKGQAPTTLQRELELAGYTVGTPEFKEQARIRLRKPVTGESATSLEKNLALAEIPKGSAEYRKIVKDYLTRSGDKISIDLGTKTEASEMAKSSVRRYDKIQEQAEVARQNIYSLDVLDNIDVSTGRAEPMKQRLAAWGKSMGINTDKLANVPAGEAYTAEAGKVVLNAMAAQKGPQTESDMRQIRTTVAGLGKSPEANSFINNSARAMSLRKIEQAEFYDNYYNKNDTLKGASKAWNDYKRNTPMVSNKLKSNGLPVFYYQFSNDMESINPGITREEILLEWQKQHGER